MKSSACSDETSGPIFEGVKPHSGCASPGPPDKARVSPAARSRYRVVALPETFRSGKAVEKAPLVEHAALHPRRVRARKECSEGAPRSLHAGAQSHLLGRYLRRRREVPRDFHRQSEIRSWPMVGWLSTLVGTL